jgi:hypothetical protein
MIGAFAAAAVLVQCGVHGIALAATWWPSATVFSRPARIGLAANHAGSFLLVDGRAGNETASCEPVASAFALGGPESPQRGTAFGTAGNVIPGSPSFEPDGRSVAIFLLLELHSEFAELLEGSSSAPATLSPVEPLGTSVLSTNVFVAHPAVMSATGSRGDVAVADVQDTTHETSIAVRLAGSTEWSRETLKGYSAPEALAVDGLGDTTVLTNTESGSAYFASPGASFTLLSIPGNYFTAIASDATGRSAIAGYTSSGPDGPGLYLSRRESPYAPFGTPVLLSSLSRDQHLQLAYDASGVLTVVWSEGSRLAVTTAEPGWPVGVAQILSAPGATVASDEQLSVDAAGEAILAWTGGAHEEFQQTGEVLHGVPAPVFATVRRSDSELFQTVQQLSTSALYSEGMYRYSPEARAVDAISSGRAMVAWLEEGATGPDVKAALYAGQPGCASPPEPVAVPLAPSLLSLRESAKIWRESNTLPKISTSNRKKLPVGTTFTFTLTEPASVTFIFTESVNGRRVRKKCVAQTRKNKHDHRCTSTIVAGTMLFPAHAGNNKVRFDGRVSKHTKLKPRSYTLLVRATASGKRSATRTLHFTIVSG